MKTPESRRLEGRRDAVDAIAPTMRWGSETAGVVLDSKKEGMSLRDDAWPLYQSLRLPTPLGCSHLAATADAGSISPQ